MKNKKLALREVFKGIVVPQLTPFNKDKTLNLQVMAQHTEWLCTQKVNGRFRRVPDAHVG